jgi:hypothetical protein
MTLILSYNIISQYPYTQVVLVAFVASNWLIIYPFVIYVTSALDMTLTLSELRCAVKFPHGISGNTIIVKYLMFIFLKFKLAINLFGF